MAAKVFDIINDEWKPWFRRHKWLPGKQQETWAAWFTFLRVLFGDKLSAADLELFHRCTGRTDVPGDGFREAYLICGRRSGKSRMLAMIAVFIAVFRDWSPYLSPGERGTVMILSADRKQSRAIFNYAAAFLKALDVDTVEVERETMDALELGNGISIEIGTANFRTVRGYTIVAGLLDEAAFWSDGGANPDQEILSALRPAMATIPQAMMLVASSPYRKAGILYDGWRKHFGNDGDSALCWVAPTRVMNPSISEEFIRAEIEKDPLAGESEYNARFRDDISSFITSDLIDAAILKDTQVLPPEPDRAYTAFCDVSGGVHDAHTLAISYCEDDGTAVLACARELKSSNTESVVSEFATLLKNYGLSSVHGDRYGQHWVIDAFARHDIQLNHSPYDRSQLYLNLIPALTAGKVRLLDVPRLRSQFLALERRVLRGSGKEIVDHPASGANASDDLSNSAAGSLVMAATGDRRRIEWTLTIPGSSKTMADFEATRDPAEPLPGDPLYARAWEMRRGVVIAGSPLPWPEILKRVRDEAALLERRW
jgi:hypothetical protein